MSKIIAQDLLNFIAQSPTPFHATGNAAQLLEANGFEKLTEDTRWKCQTNKAYFVTRNDSSIIAFRTGDSLDQGINMVGAHTDSPCLRIKPNAEISKHGYFQLGVEVYGGALLNPWFDRDLSIAGRVSGLDENGELISELIDIKKAVAVIPSLAIHLDREANKNRTINPQNHLPLIVAQVKDAPDSKTPTFKAMLLAYCTDTMQTILDFELSCYDTQAPSFIGLNEEFISSSRLDNLLSTYLGLRAIIDTDTNKACLYVSTDHEEIGSASHCGAKGNFLESVLERLINDKQALTQTLHQSTLLSCDNAHAVHPNFSDKHDQNHGPLLNQGPVIKTNANQHYATNSVTSARFQNLCQQQNIPVQQFVVRSDMGCGSTIGPITATELGIETLDIGAPQWAMHSIRETAGTQDCDFLYRAIKVFLEQ